MKVYFLRFRHLAAALALTFIILLLSLIHISNKTTPYEFYQYWRNVGDADVMKCLRMLTFLPLEQIDEMDKWEGSQLNKAKEILAYELTKLVHSEEEAEKAQEASRALFGAGASSANMPSTEIAAEDFGEGLTITDIMVRCKLVSSKGEARRLTDQGGVSVNDVKVTSATQVFTADDVKKGDFIIKKGKKTFHKVICK